MSDTCYVLNLTLYLSVSVFSLQRVEEFLDAGCDVNCLDSERTRNTPLHWAASYSTADILQMLIGMSQYYSSHYFLTQVILSVCRQLFNNYFSSYLTLSMLAKSLFFANPMGNRVMQN